MYHFDASMVDRQTSIFPLASLHRRQRKMAQRNRNGPPQSNNKSLFLLVCVMPLIPPFQCTDESFLKYGASARFIFQYDDALIDKGIDVLIATESMV
jgi:hypothetical protein